MKKVAQSLWMNRHMMMGYFWMILFVPAYLWWQESILLVIIASFYANVKTDFGTHQSLQARKAIVNEGNK